MRRGDIESRLKTLLLGQFSSTEKLMNIFDEVTPIEKQHTIYKLMCDEKYEPERAVLIEWAKDFIDRDGKFQYEFQTTFESCLWELYLNAYLKELGASIDYSFPSPDFITNVGEEVCIEATIAAPSVGGTPPYGYNISDIPEDFNEFNSQATLRICNSFITKAKKYKNKYSKLNHVHDKPFVIAIASFDRPFSHFSASRSILSALYGLYHDEELTLDKGASSIISYNVEGVVKNQNTDIPLGYFLNDEFSYVSAVIYSPLVTWGKIRALADNENASSVYTTFHPNEDGIEPNIKITPKSKYVEHLIDGLYILHNPFADQPLNRDTFSHSRSAQIFLKDDGELEIIAPDDFLLVRFLQTLNFKNEKRD